MAAAAVVMIDLVVAAKLERVTTPNNRQIIQNCECLVLVVAEECPAPAGIVVHAKTREHKVRERDVLRQAELGSPTLTDAGGAALLNLVVHTGPKLVVDPRADRAVPAQTINARFGVPICK